MSTDTQHTDYFGDEMVFVDNYGGHLPKSENIPTAPLHNGVSGISHDGDIYCVDCAKDMGLIVVDNSRVKAVVDGEVVPCVESPHTARVLSHHETDTLHHCGRHENCIHSVSGENHPYNHDSEIGIGIEEKTIEH